MIFTASDVSSLATSLGRWELAEYGSCALVALGCTGEYIAEFTDFWSGGIKERKDRLAKRSTLLLISALALELMCLVRTNSISGTLIGSLSDKAEKADAKAQSAIDKSSLAEHKGDVANTNSSTALSQATDALTKAGKAEASLGKAENEANKAQAASSSALTLATGARREADSFEKDIVSAKKLATDAESHLAEAQRQAADTTAELNRLKTPRLLTDPSALASALRPFKGTEYTFSSVSQDDDSVTLLKQIDTALQLAGWKRVKPPTPGGLVVNVYPDFGVPPGVATGVIVSVDSEESIDSLKSRAQEQWPPIVRTAVLLRGALFFSIFPSQGNIARDVVVESGKSTTVRITVGRKP